MTALVWYLYATCYLAIFSPLVQSGSGDQNAEIWQHLSYLASDELKGRGIGTPEIDSAAAYIARYFSEIGLKPIDGNNGYFQEFELEEKRPPEVVEFNMNGQGYSLNENILMISGASLDLKNIEVAYVDFGTEQDLEKIEVKNKIVLAKMGSPDQGLLEKYYSSMQNKRKSVQEKGALALIEIYKSESIPWARAIRYFGGAGISIKSSELEFPHFFLNDTTAIDIAKSASVSSLTVVTAKSKTIRAKNIIGYIDGTDPDLRDEVILAGAHYDHVGIGKPVTDADGEQDSIYNGARDNASGTVALMMAAKKIAQNPAKRPVAFIAFTGEESGLLGSRYYASYPSLPLENTAFYLNNDNGGYNDINIATVVGTSRSNIGVYVSEAIKKADLEMFTSADLDEGFFSRSDNISLSVKGVPSATYSLGFRQMDEDITKHYHQPSDEVESMDMDYVTKWVEGFVNSVVAISNMSERPFWVEGDEYERAGKALYQID
jgi:hypothetical protein